MIRPTFAAVRSAYKTHGTHACPMHFPNTCAIRMSEALIAASESFHEVFRLSKKNLCPHGMVRGAQDLGAILATPAVFGKPNHGWETPRTSPPEILSRKGIVCFMNIPSFAGQGHIDLWDGAGPVGQAYWTASPVWMWTLP